MAEKLRGVLHGVIQYLIGGAGGVGPGGSGQLDFSIAGNSGHLVTIGL